MLRVLSYQVSDTIDIKLFRATFKAELVHGDADELFYQTGRNEYVYVFKYGVVCFLNYDPIRIGEFLHLITPYCKNVYAEQLSEEFLIEENASEMKIGYNKIDIVSAEVEVLRLIMLNVSQSVALDYYSEQTNKLLEETNYHTQSLERKGKLDISGNALKKFIGKTLLLKNRISENLYIFDSPPETWENENLNKIDLGMKKTFDLQARFRHVSEGLQIVKDNLELFKDLLQYRNSTLLEWVIIILILVEVLNLIIDKIV